MDSLYISLDLLVTIYPYPPLLSGIIATATVVVVLVTVLWCFASIHRLRSQEQNESGQQRLRAANIQNNRQAQSSISFDKDKDTRRLKILTSVIHKKVLQRNQTAGSHDHHNIVFPHEESLSRHRFAMVESFSDNESLLSSRPLPFLLVVVQAKVRMI